MKNLIALVCGLVFGIGLVIYGMTNPAKVLGFLDVFGQWDPTLAFVMAGAPRGKRGRGVRQSSPRSRLAWRGLCGTDAARSRPAPHSGRDAFQTLRPPSRRRRFRPVSCTWCATH